jgi:catechol 2,3-dioxygenase-like lactoylglutathione lyase family enzyme
MLSNSETFSGFSVDDIDRAAEFYEKTLGLEVDRQGPGLSLHTAGGNDVFVYPKPDHQPATFTVLNFQVPEIEEAVTGLRERGVEFERYEGTEIETDSSGVFRGGGPLIAWFKDPAGNVLAVIEEGSG